MYLKAHGKINIALNVVGKLNNGYHELDMIMVPLRVHDTIAVSRLSKKQDNRVLLNDGSIAIGLNDICGKTIKLITEKYNIKKKYEFDIYKEIPMEAGMGGGSSDAASIFKFYNKKFRLKISNEEAIKMLLPIGSDIPFFIVNKPARVKGQGEIIEPIEIKNDYYVLIVKPRQGLSTKDIYNELDKLKIKVTDIDKVIEALKIGDDNMLSKYMLNSLEEPAMNKCNKIKEIKEFLISKGLPLTLMTGSGTAVFSLSNNIYKIEEIANHLRKLNYEAFYTKLLK